MEFTTSHRSRFDLRRNPRRADGRRARIEPRDGSPSRECMVWDISDGGARLVVHAPETLPAEFILVEGAERAFSRRTCQIVWRAEAQVGVQFLTETATTAT
jgi:PilZ domain